MQLAEAFGIDPEEIRQGLKCKPKKYMEKVDYYVLKNEELVRFKCAYPRLVPCDEPKVSLWTLQGVYKQAEEINLSNVWLTFKALISSYFFTRDLTSLFENSELHQLVHRMEEGCKLAVRLIEEVKGISGETLSSVAKLKEHKTSSAPMNWDTMASDIAVQLKLYSKSGSPHGQLIGAIAQTLQMPVHKKDKYEDENIIIRPDQSNVDGYWQVYYKPEGIQRIIEWFYQNKENIHFQEYYKRNTAARKKGELRGHGYIIHGKHFWLKI